MYNQSLKGNLIKNTYFKITLSVLLCFSTIFCTNKTNKTVSVTDNFVGATDQLYVTKTEINKKTLVGSSYTVLYTSLWEPNSVVFKGLGTTMTSIAKNNKQVTGAVHVILQNNPTTTDSIKLFIGVPVNNADGFLPNEIYTIKAGSYFSSTANSELSLVKNQHQNMQNLLNEKGYKIQFPIMEVWSSGIITDKINNNKINLLYPNL